MNYLNPTISDELEPMQLLQLVPRGTAARSMANMVDATGTQHFGSALLEHLQRTCGADYCAVFRLSKDAPVQVDTGSFDGSQTAQVRVTEYMNRAYWAKDPAMEYAQKSLSSHMPMLMRTDVRLFDDLAARETIWPRIRDRVVIAGRSGCNTFSMSVLRESRSKFSANEIDRVAASADLLISILAKHAALVGKDHLSAKNSIASLQIIEASVIGKKPLTVRESQVCARILYGMTTTGIALDLGISGETVKTFRKIAYRKLEIGSERELLKWYLDLGK